MAEVRAFSPDDLQSALSLFGAEGWSSYTQDPARALRALTAPGSVTLVATEGSNVVGLVQVQSDGQIQAHLSTIVVATDHRRQGLARELLAAAFQQAGGTRLDLISIADDFYRGLGARPFPGFRLDASQLLTDRAAQTS
jgi:ribosomal protein S18 acetylase RimI-like enzyme